jgi:hypothetical protein
MTRVVEIRTYRLKPGAKARFHQLVLTQSLPLLQRFGTRPHKDALRRLVTGSESFRPPP